MGRENLDFSKRPLVLIWETTQACDLSCVHCRACAQPLRNTNELSTAEGKRLIDQVAELEVPIFVLTGGDPIKRPDIMDLVEYAVQKGVRPCLTPSATPLLTREIIFELKKRGLARLAISLDGPSAAAHDLFRGVPGTFERACNAIRWAHEAKLPVQVNTTITRFNYKNIAEMLSLMEELQVVLWSVFFLVPTGRGKVADLLSPQEVEEVFEQLYEGSRRVKFHIKTTEGQHYRRVLIQKKKERKGANAVQMEDVVPHGAVTPMQSMMSGAGPGVNDGKGFVFVSHEGNVYPSGFLPLSGGNIRTEPLKKIYQESPLFVSLRDSSLLKGKCGACEYKEVCGGSRARAYALTGDLFAEEYCCAYMPAGFVKEETAVGVAG